MPKGAGGRRRKRRTHVVPAEDAQTDTSVPRSLVFRRGKVPPALHELVVELRAALQPHTATRLQERPRADLRDYLDVAAQLGVSHFFMLSAGDAGANLRVARVPRGPTLTFRVRAYSLAADVKRTQRRPAQVSPVDMQQHAPLLILNNFGDDDDDDDHAGGNKAPAHVELMATMFQNMFPPLDVASVDLSNGVQRCVLLDWDAESGTVEWRNYAIRTAPVGLSRAVRKIIQRSGRRRGVLPLHSLDDISQALLDDESMVGAYSSESEGEGPTDTHVEAVRPPKRLGPARRQPQQQNGGVHGDDASKESGRRGGGDGGGDDGGGRKCSVRLTEIGPRLTLQLVKVEENLCQGDVLYHSFVRKGRAEAAELKRRAEERARVKRQRREEQEEHVRRKRAQRRPGRGDHCDHDDSGGEGEEREEERRRDGGDSSGDEQEHDE